MGVSGHYLIGKDQAVPFVMEQDGFFDNFKHPFLSKAAKTEIH